MRESLQPFQTVRDVLAKVLELHDACHARFAEAAKRTDDHRFEALLAFVASREQEQSHAVGRTKTRDDDALESYVQSVPADVLEDVKRTGCPDGDFDTVLADAQHRDDAFVKLYEQLADNVGPRAGAIFHDLAEMHRRNHGRLHEALLDF